MLDIKWSQFIIHKNKYCLMEGYHSMAHFIIGTRPGWNPMTQVNKVLSDRMRSEYNVSNTELSCKKGGLTSFLGGDG